MKQTKKKKSPNEFYIQNLSFCSNKDGVSPKFCLKQRMNLKERHETNSFTSAMNKTLGQTESSSLIRQIHLGERQL